MKFVKSHFEMNVRFRNGIFLLAVFVVVLLFVYHYFPYPKAQSGNLKELSEYQRQIDSLKNLEVQKKKEREEKPFNPNFITPRKAEIIGLSGSELDRLLAYRKSGKWINSTEDFKKVTKVSDSLLQKISPKFVFPEWVIERNKQTKTTKTHTRLTFAQKGDLNSVTLEELVKEIGVPEFIADRIIKYRNSIEGFLSDIQLKDINGLYAKQRNQILARYTVKSTKQIQKININTASVKQLIEVPYFDFETALSIRDFIKSNGSVNAFEELKNIDGFSVDKIDRIALYLTLN